MKKGAERPLCFLQNVVDYFLQMCFNSTLVHNKKVIANEFDAKL